MSKIEEALKKLEKTYGKGVVIHGDKSLGVPKRSSGILSLDLALGGGFGKGRIVEVFGVESSGKTTVSIHAMAQVQIEEPDKYVLIIDAEHALDTEYCRTLGLDLAKAIICQPDNGEQGLQVAVDLIGTGEISFALIDSIPALVPISTIEGEMEDVQMAVHARMISRFLQKITATASKTDTTVYMVNQIRNKIGGYGNAETTPGGFAPRYYASQRIQIRAGQNEKEGAEVKNKVVNYTVIKNKIAAPFKKGTLYINFGTGVDKVRDLWDAALRLGVINVTGRTYTVLGVKLSSKSKDDAYETFSGTVEIHDEIYKTCIDLLKDGAGDTQEHPTDISDDQEGSF